MGSLMIREVAIGFLLGFTELPSFFKMKGRGYLWAFYWVYRVFRTFVPGFTEFFLVFTEFLLGIYHVVVTFSLFFVCVAVACRNGAISSLFFCLFLFIFRFFGPKSR